ncbi:MAG: Rrf2 family transcriptional regulator [Oscillospiraceae bacterium]
MHMTQEADYAVRIVYCLAQEKARRDAKFISEKMGVSLRFSLKILRKLVASGIVKSFKGQRGGYELAKEPINITLNDVIETVDGPYALNRCLKNGHECSLDDSSCCAFRAVYADISSIITAKLNEITFEQMMKS